MLWELVVWLIKLNKWTKSNIFLSEKHTLFRSQFSPQNAGNHIVTAGLWHFNTFWRSIQLVTLFKPAGYFSFYWNPCHGVVSLKPNFQKREMHVWLVIVPERCWQEGGDRVFFMKIIIIIIIKALFKTERPLSEVREEDAGINRWSVSINYMIKKKNGKKSRHYIYDQSYLNQWKI